MRALQELFPEISEQQLSRLVQYADLLCQWNQRVNLVSRQDVTRLWPHHLLPSLILLKIFPLPPGATCLDLGTGAGLPGIPLKILRPDLELVLVDSIRKKILFLKMVLDALNLTRCLALQGRLEPNSAPPQLRKNFDFVFARAVTSLENLLPLARPLLKPGGSLLAWKGESDEPELRQAARKLGFRYQILSVPSRWHHLSPKFSQLRIFQIFPED